MITDYRKRCYDSYFESIWKHTHKPVKADYDFYTKISRKRFKNILIEDKDARICDVACGAGHFLYFLNASGYTNTSGIDISPQMISVSEKMGINNIRQSDMFEFLPKNKNSFDMVVANDVIEHFKKPEILDFLDLIYKSLKSGGMVLISTLNNQALSGGRIMYCDFTHETGFTSTSLAQVLRICGFKSIRIYGEKPVIYDIRSLVRNALWRIVKGLLQFYNTVERGIGRGFRQRKDIFEPRIFAVARKPDSEKK